MGEDAFFLGNELCHKWLFLQFSVSELSSLFNREEVELLPTGKEVVKKQSSRKNGKTSRGSEASYPQSTQRMLTDRRVPVRGMFKALSYIPYFLTAGKKMPVRKKHRNGKEEYYHHIQLKYPYVRHGPPLSRSLADYHEVQERILRKLLLDTWWKVRMISDPENSLLLLCFDSREYTPVDKTPLRFFPQARKQNGEFNRERQ